MKTLHVTLGQRSYPIYVGQGLLAQPELLTQHITGQQVMIVTNKTVAPIYLERIRRNLKGYTCEFVILPDGEKYKNLEVLNDIFDALLAYRFERSATLIALGGGVIGDMTGFAAACYQRGVAFIQIPTTLLAQVDSSVGGKTGVNHPLGKNMIGAFYQPRCVITDTDVLNTLNDRELRAGIAEVIKYGLIRDLPFFEWLESKIDALLKRDADALTYAIERSCINKAEVVAADEKESGIRALLNLGHTFGHAIETGLGYGVWLHGEAVATGMCLAADLSHMLNWVTWKDLTRIVALIKRAHLPHQIPAFLSTERMLELMAVDKKVKSGKLHLILLKSIGKGVISSEFDTDMVRATIEASRAK
jgi:3-dehydroquinate synthase